MRFLVVVEISLFIISSLAVQEKPLRSAQSTIKKGFANSMKPINTNINKGLSSNSNMKQTITSTTGKNNMVGHQTSMESIIQQQIENTPGLREAMQYYELDTMKSGREQTTPKLSKFGVHQKLLEVTWDTFAGFREHRHQESEIPHSMELFMMQLAGACVENNGKIMDVGCGNAILLKFIKQYALKNKQTQWKDGDFYGVDLSSEMIRLCQEKYPKANFYKCDFLEYNPLRRDEEKFATIIFNECLHNFVHIPTAISKASQLLVPGGSIIISHPRGYSNILTQHRANKWLVPSILPSEREWSGELLRLHELQGLELTVKPNIKGDHYLAVLKKT